MAYARVNGVELYYEEHGIGEPMLLIMGFGGNTEAWAGQIPELSRYLHVIAFDNRGAGRSEKPDGPYSMEVFADDAAGLLQYLGVDSAHVFGVSMGGMIAQHLALRHPERVRTLILGCTTPGGPQAVSPSPEVIAAFQAGGQERDPRKAAEIGFFYMYSDEYLSQNREALLDRAERLAHLRAPEEGLRGHFQAVMGHNALDRLHEVRVPTLVLTGDADPLVPPENSRLIASRIPGARLVEFPGMKHGFFIEGASLVNRVIIDFVRTHAVSAQAAAAGS
ncbi:MAG TPA: alpha/beta fold hydrolase [Dehalococcoidia bacterium]|nr:alpha/beta fold hydrolase [Dehalococcoidia bacterium]